MPKPIKRSARLFALVLSAGLVLGVSACAERPDPAFPNGHVTVTDWSGVVSRAGVEAAKTDGTGAA